MGVVNNFNITILVVSVVLPSFTKWWNVLYVNTFSSVSLFYCSNAIARLFVCAFFISLFFSTFVANKRNKNLKYAPFCILVWQKTAIERVQKLVLKQLYSSFSHTGAPSHSGLDHLDYGRDLMIW